MGRYKKPRKLNFVSFLLILAALGAGYAGFQFGPHYYHKWKARGILSDAANRCYPKRMSEGIELFDFLQELQNKTTKRLREMGIEDPKMKVKITMGAKEITAQASYVVVIKHPFVDKTTTLYFRPTSSVSKHDRSF